MHSVIIKNMMKILPIGTQSFQRLREDDNLYVDKTSQMYRLAHAGRFFFLSRPRRFGKSLLLSTLKAYFEGKKELFEGLAVTKLEKEWKSYPVLHVDLNTGLYTSAEGLEEVLDSIVSDFEQRYSLPKKEGSYAIRFRNIVEKLGKTVILIDEYDKPLISTLDNPELNNQFRAMLKSFYSVLKTCDQNIHFAFITGVSKFSHVSIFSDLNNLRDISLNADFSDICGITEKELHTCFPEYVSQMAKDQGITDEQVYEQLKAMYDGYHFANDMTDVYNPFSLLNAFADRDFRNYWYQSGTPTFLIKLLNQHKINPTALSQGEIAVEDPMDAGNDYDKPFGIFYQTGYLTIKGHNTRRNLYKLGFPNWEVESSFLRNLIPLFLAKTSTQLDSFLWNSVDGLYEGKIEEFMRALKEFMSGIPYEIIRNDEKYYQTVIFMIFRVMGVFQMAEYATADGRIDLLVTAEDYLYLFEFKVDKTPEEAMAQINDKEYLLPFRHDNRKRYKIGVNFSTEKRNIDEWVIEEDC